MAWCVVRSARCAVLIADDEGGWVVSRGAVFLDRDGVINRNRVDHVKTWGEFEFLSGALEALHCLAGLDWPVVVVTNQAAIGRGLVARPIVEEIHARMIAAVRAAGGRIDEVLYCPHRPDENCGCRKPRPGLLVQAAEHLALDLGASYLVGDGENDLLAAREAGCTPVLVKTGLGAEELKRLRGGAMEGVQIAEDLAGAVAWILHQESVGSSDRLLKPEGLGRS